MKPARRVAWYRFRTTFHRQRGGYLALVALIGLVGGVALASVAGARRTQSAFPAYVASTNPSDVNVVIGVYNPTVGLNTGYDPATFAAAGKLPHVRHIGAQVGLNALPLGPDGAPAVPASIGAQQGLGGGTLGGEGFTLDKARPSAGRVPDSTTAMEFAMDPAAAATFGFHIGQVVSFGFYADAQTLDPAFGTAAVQPFLRIEATLVGLGFSGVTGLFQDDVDASTASGFVFGPAVTARVVGCCANFTSAYLQLDRPGSTLAVQREVSKLLPAGFPPGGAGVTTASFEAKAERAVKPEAIALAVFGGIAGLAALLIASQVLGRQIRLAAGDLAVLRALGADPVMVAADQLPGLLGAIVTGSLLAAAVAVLLSPIAPLGILRRVYPTPGIAADWAVLGLGVAGLIVALDAITILLVWRAAPHRTALDRVPIRRQSMAARAAAGLGLPAPAGAGIRFALDPGAGPATAPVRSAILAAVLAVAVVTATITFGASLHTLATSPTLYGWNWSYQLNAGSGSGDIPPDQAARLLDADPDVAAWGGYWFANLQVNGQYVPVLGGSPNAAVGPAVLTGHALQAPNEVVLGATTLADLGKHVGDTVLVGNSDATAVPLVIAGTATMPAIGSAGGSHLEMGIGALVPDTLLSATDKNPFDDPVIGPNAIFVRLRPGRKAASALAGLNQIATALSTTANFGVAVTAVQRPAEIIAYRSVGTTPALLGGALALGAVVALGLTLLASVRRRRRDLALLKTLGFTGRQLASTVAWQSSVAVGLGTLVGVPAGIVAGRFLWDLFAKEIHAVAHPTIPALPVLLLAAGGLVLANVVAAIPGRIAARTPTALVLRAG